MKKRILPILLTVAMLTGCGSQNMTIIDQNGKSIPISSAEKNTYTFKLPAEEDITFGWNNPFYDVSENDWFYLAVRFCNENGFISGATEYTFNPYAEANRAMIIAILWRLEGSPQAEPNSFTDVSPDAYYADAVSWGVEEGIISGYSKDTFAPNEKVTREQMASILYRYASYHGWDISADQNLDRFTDAEEASGYAEDALCWATSHGIINGMENNRLDPRGNATRAQVASILRSFCLNIML